MADDDIIAEAKEAFELAQDTENENRLEALDDLKFLHLPQENHWPEALRTERETAGQPCLVIPKLGPVVRQVINDARQNKPAINVHPVDDASDPDTADILNGLIRNIEQSSDAEVAYDTALECAVTGGVGYFKINTRYAHDDTFEQDIVIERVADPFSIYGDPNSTAADSSDWETAFEFQAFSKKAFEKRWKGEEACSFASVDTLTGMALTTAAEVVMVAAYWRREETERKIVLLQPPEVDPTPEQMAALEAIEARDIMDASVYEANKALFDALGVVVTADRVVPTHKVVQRLLSGDAVLEENDWAGKYIPIIPVYGEDRIVEGKRVLKSLIRDAKDAQRMFNYMRSKTAESVAEATRTPFIGPKGSFKSAARKWATANSDSHAFIEYDPVDFKGTVLPPPQRQPYVGVDPGAMQEALNASEDIKAITGIYDASLGAKSNETSGRAIRARQMEGDTGTFHYIDNLSRAIRHAGRVLVDLAPKTYPSERVLRIIGPTGEVDRVKVNAPSEREVRNPQTGQMEKISKIYDLTVGRYDVTVKAGPSFTSRREEFVTMATELIRAYPPAAPLLIDRIVENFDLPGGKELAERFKNMLPPQALGDNPMMEQAKQAVQQLQGKLAEAVAEIQAMKTDQGLEARKLDIEKYRAETERGKVEGELENKERDRRLAALEELLTQLTGGVTA